jgi:LPS sulfotransferase NodH
LKPSTYPFSDIKKNPVAEVVKQVADCRREMEDELALPGVNSLTIEYAEMCKDPHATVAVVRSKISEMWRPIELVDCDFPQLSASSHPKMPYGLEW